MKDASVNPMDVFVGEMMEHGADMKQLVGSRLDEIEAKYPKILDHAGMMAAAIALQEPLLTSRDLQVCFIALSQVIVKEVILNLERANETSPIG